MFPAIYSIPLIPTGDGHYKAGEPGGGNGWAGGLSGGYADTFKRDRAPTQLELLSHLVGTAYRCANLNANLVASTRLRLYLRTRKGEPKAKFATAREAMGRKVTIAIPAKRIKRLAAYGACGKSALLDATESGDGDVEEVTEHPFLDLMRHPEDAATDGGLSAYDHRWLIQVLLETVGVAYLYIAERNEFGQPKRLLLLRSQNVKPIPDPSGKRYILRYEYGTAKLAPEDVIRFALPDPGNPHFGVLPPMRAAIEKIRLVRGGDAFTTAILENGGYPAGVWSPKGDSEGGGVGDVEARRMESKFRRAFAMANAGRIFVSETPGTLQTLAWKPAEIVDVARSEALQGEIADCFDVPRTKLFRDSSNRASGEQGDIDHQRDAGISRCSRFEEVINGQLLPLFDDSGRLFVAFDSPVKDDRTMVLEEAKAGVSLGLASIDEGRSALGMDALDDDLGKSRLVPGTLVLLGEDGEGKPLTPPPPAPVAGPAMTKPKPKKTKGDDRLAEALIVMAKALAMKHESPAVVSVPVPAPIQTTASPIPDVKAALISAGYDAAEADAKLSEIPKQAVASL